MTGSTLIEIHKVLSELFASAPKAEYRLDNKHFLCIKEETIHVFRADLASTEGIVVDMMFSVPVLNTRAIPTSNLAELSFCACKKYNNHFMMPDDTLIDFVDGDIDESTEFQMSVVHKGYEFYILANYIYNIEPVTFMYMHSVTSTNYDYILEMLKDVQVRLGKY